MKKILLLSLISLTGFGHGFDEWYSSLNDDQKKLVDYEFSSKDRKDWHYIPMDKRKGLVISDMTKKQKDDMFHLMSHIFSEQGMAKIKAVIEMEKVLKEYEGDHRDPDKFYFTLFGKPYQGKWGFSFEGHHISLNFTFEGKELISGTPLFYGANPATILPNKSSVLKEGERPLAFAEDAALALLNSMSEDQKKSAWNTKIQMRDMKEARQGSPGKYDPAGITYKQLNPTQQQALDELIRKAYINDLNPIFAEKAWNKIKATKDSIRFTYYGAASLTEPHHYQIIGEDLVLLLFNVQNGTQKTPVNHVHQLWRSRSLDFGGK